MQQDKKGLFAGLAAYCIWGTFPIYWKMLEHVPAMQILAHRIFWSFVFLLIIVLILRNQNFIPYLKNRRVVLLLLLSSVLIAINWGVYIYAVNNHQIVDASLGYYINPIVNIGLGVIFLRERLNKMQVLAVGFALAGLAFLAFSLGRLPVISLVLAFSFGFYSLVRKKANLQSMPGLLIETMLLAPIAALYLWKMYDSGTGSFLTGTTVDDVLMVLAGPVTALPLFLFGVAATKVPLSTLGFIQYL